MPSTELLALLLVAVLSGMVLVLGIQWVFNRLESKIFPPIGGKSCK